MLRHLFTPITLVLLSGGLQSPSVQAAEFSGAANSAVAVRPNGGGIQTEDHSPFTHVAYIPAGADLSTIRFEKARMVEVPSRFLRTTDAGCNERAFRDPDGSACPGVRTIARVSAYEVTYSYLGEAMASDEYAGRKFTFSVYFLPSEVAPQSGRKLGRSDLAELFAVSTSRATTRGVAVDHRESFFCEGNYAEGAWAQTDAACKDMIRYKAVTASSSSITVRVDPASPEVQRTLQAAKK